MGLTATFTHMLLWNFDDIKTGWAWASPSALKRWFKLETYKFWANQETPEQRLERKLNDESLDPHYRLMLRNLYDECPQWWWGAVLLGSFVAGIACLYAIKSTLPWWGFILANILTAVFMLFFGAQYGLTGFQFNVRSHPHPFNRRKLTMFSIYRFSQSAKCLRDICSLESPSPVSTFAKYSLLKRDNLTFRSPRSLFHLLYL